ncbi:MAG: hypothetical protein Alpg2KO_28810 [Alphaproteobacteria bacterium]
MSDFPRGGSSRVGNFFAGGIKKWFIGGLVAVMGVTALMGIYTVDEREVAVIDKFGAIERVETEPGLHFKTPWIEGATFYDKALQSCETEPMTIKTEDGQELQDVRLKVQWKIQPDQVEYYRSELQDPEGRLTSLLKRLPKVKLVKSTPPTSPLSVQQLRARLKTLWPLVLLLCITST